MADPASPYPPGTNEGQVRRYVVCRPLDSPGRRNGGTVCVKRPTVRKVCHRRYDSTWSKWEARVTTRISKGSGGGSCDICSNTGTGVPLPFSIPAIILKFCWKKRLTADHCSYSHRKAIFLIIQIWLGASVWVLLVLNIADTICRCSFW